MTSHWGALPVVSDIDSGIAAVEREQITKLRPMEVEGPRLHQPVTATPHLVDTEPLPPENFSIDSLTLHTIKLIQYAKKVKSNIQSVQLQFENKKDGEGDVVSFPATPPIPDCHNCKPKHRTQNHLPFMMKDLDSDFVRGFGKAPPEIDSISRRNLLRRSVAAVCAHSGYDVCPESVLETLTDITHEYFLKITKLLRTAVDNEALNGRTGFQDVMQQVFHEMNIGSPTVLHEFYQTRIVQYHNNMIQKCQKLFDEFEKVKRPDYKPPEDYKAVKVKEELVSDINFPLTEGDDDEGEEDVDDTEELLHLAGLSGYDIKLEQDPGTGINSEEVDAQTIKTEPVDTRMLDSYGDPDSISDNSHKTTHLGSDMTESIPDPGSVPASDIMSPPATGSRPPKKKKKR